jgi:hypothetical protein
MGDGGQVTYFFPFILSLGMLHTDNWLCRVLGSASKVCVVVGGGWVVESEFSDRLWLSFSLALAKPNKRRYYFLLNKKHRHIFSLYLYMYAESWTTNGEMFVKYSTDVGLGGFNKLLSV